MVRPKSFPNVPERNADSVITSFSPSAPQNLLRANGRSIDIQSTTTFLREEASLLKRFTDNAQIPVSMDGNMLNTMRFPVKEFWLISVRSDFVRTNDGTFEPIDGSVPHVVVGVPLNVIVDISKRPFWNSDF